MGANYQINPSNNLLNDPQIQGFHPLKVPFNSTLRACPDPCLLQPLATVQIPWFQAQSLHFLMHFTSHPVVHVVVHILLIVIKKLPNPMSFCQNIPCFKSHNPMFIHFLHISSPKSSMSFALQTTRTLLQLQPQL